MSVLVGAHPDEVGRVAVEAAVQECFLRDADLAVITCAGGSTDAETASWAAFLGEVRERLATSGRELRGRVEETSEIAQVVLDQAESEPVEVIVLGLRRRTPVGKLLLGSHAQRILLEAPCPVLTVTLPEPS